MAIYSETQTTDATAELESQNQTTNQDQESQESSAPAPNSVSEPDKVKQTMKAIRQERDTFKRELSTLRTQFKALEGLDPEKYREMQSELERVRAQQEQLEEIEQRFQSEKEAEIQKYVKEVNDYKGQLEQYKTDRLIEAAYAANGGRMEEDSGVSFTQLYLEQNRKRFVRDKNNKLIVLDDNGRPLLDKQTGARIDPVEYIAMTHKRHPVFGAFFKAERKSGYGDFNQPSDGNTYVDEDYSKMSPDEAWSDPNLW